jgi:hypothetical protein
MLNSQEQTQTPERQKTRMKPRYAIVLTLVGLMLGAIPAQASTSATAANTVAPNMKVSVNVQTAVELTLATGSSGCAISAGGGQDYQMSFGNVNGLGVGTPSCGIVSGITGSNATYATTYNLVASFSGFSTVTGPAVVVTTPGFTHSSTLTLGEGSTTAGPFTTVPATGNAVTIATATSGATVSRALAVTVSNTNGAGAFPGTYNGSGADSAVVTFTLTVQ